ncbi:hypothetical protein C2845_PM13G10070 [Panicum miliaceum]|uniref:Uncharacterized protein n=1 Tax=Panicum miliaceum TaxID=4540 RepID=A0A3L6RH35_PANMI|nr:hypothetical protein C2845_PM13G10070 [Panicum miliaceum]
MGIVEEAHNLRVVGEGKRGVIVLAHGLGTGAGSQAPAPHGPIPLLPAQHNASARKTEAPALLPSKTVVVLHMQRHRFVRRTGTPPFPQQPALPLGTSLQGAKLHTIQRGPSHRARPSFAAAAAAAAITAALMARSCGEEGWVRQG